MRLRLQEFQADPEEPFLHDKLSRQQHVEALCRVLRSIEGHATVSIDAPWGAGKTAFVKMCSAHLQSRGVRVVQFNAWQENYTQNPLVDVVSAISAQIKNARTESIVKTAKQAAVALGYSAIRLGSHGLIDPSELKRDDSTMYAAWDDAKKDVEEFTETLGKFLSSESGAVVVFIDELDRCRPAYALQLLDAVRCLLSVDGLVIVLSVNRDELCHSVEAIYGPTFNTDRYLRRFVDLSIGLPVPDEEDLSSFLTMMLETSGLDSRFRADGYERPMLEMVADLPGCSLRDVQQAVHLAAVAVASVEPSSGFPLDPSAIKRQAAVALIVLRILDKKAYQRLCRGDIDAFSAVAAMNAALGEDPKWREGSKASDMAHTQVEALLLLTARTYWQQHGTEQEAFINNYTSKIADDQDRAQRVWDVRDEKAHYVRGHLDIGPVADLIELVHSNIDT